MNAFLTGNTVAIIGNSPDDLSAFRSLLPKAGLTTELLEFPNVSDAAPFFHQVALSSPDSLPRLVIVDLQLPSLSGFHFLWWLRSQRHFDAMAALVLTSAKEKRHIASTRYLPNDHYVSRYPRPAMISRVYHRVVTTGPLRPVLLPPAAQERMTDFPPSIGEIEANGVLGSRSFG